MKFQIGQKVRINDANGAMPHDLVGEIGTIVGNDDSYGSPRYKITIDKLIPKYAGQILRIVSNHLDALVTKPLTLKDFKNKNHA